MAITVITGIGLVTPLGLGRDNSWNRLLLGQSAVKRDEQFKEILSARVHGIDVPPEARTLSLAFLAAAEAVSDSGLEGLFTDFSRFGCTVSASKPNILNSKGKIGFSDLFLQSTVGRQVARILKLGGPVINVSAACATGAISIITAARWIESGLCDMVLAGAVECPFHPLYVAGFERMGVLAKNAARPFDAEREGFAMGEGSGIILLENKGHAMLRGAKMYGEISGWGLANDTCDEVSYDGSGKSVVLAVEKALEMSSLRKIDYIHAHGTGTRLNDPMETKAYKNVFGRSAKKISISSTKAATGHMLGASGAVGTAFACLSMRDNAVPPTLNLSKPDPECGLDYTPNKTADKDINSAMSVSFGFGGQTAAVCVKKL